ncbi:MAG: hypothetical protein DMF88_07645, partial [Acidobacteria bacterium]
MVAAQFVRQIAELDRVAMADHHQALDHVFQLAHVAGPRILGERGDGLGRDRAHGRRPVAELL